MVQTDRVYKISFQYDEIIVYFVQKTISIKIIPDKINSRIN